MTVRAVRIFTQVCFLGFSENCNGN